MRKELTIIPCLTTHFKEGDEEVFPDMEGIDLKSFVYHAHVPNYVINRAPNIKMLGLTKVFYRELSVNEFIECCCQKINEWIEERKNFPLIVFTEQLVIPSIVAALKARTEEPEVKFIVFHPRKYNDVPYTIRKVTLSQVICKEELILIHISKQDFKEIITA